jgi:hypothetical protein
MSDEKDFKKKFKKSTEDKVKKNSTKLYPVSNKDIDVIKGDSAYLQSPVINSVKPKPKPSKEAGTNTYAKDNQRTIKKLKA